VKFSKRSLLLDRYQKLNGIDNNSVYFFPLRCSYWLWLAGHGASLGCLATWIHPAGNTRTATTTTTDDDDDDDDDDEDDADDNDHTVDDSYLLQAVYIVYGILNGPVLGVMTLGMFFPWANKHVSLQ
jgi:hypothetical protein